jgi:hypothetical protein
MRLHWVSWRRWGWSTTPNMSTVSILTILAWWKDWLLRIQSHRIVFCFYKVMILTVILLKIRRNGLIREKLFAIHQGGLFAIKLTSLWGTSSNMAVKFKHRATCIANMLTELGVRRSWGFAILMCWRFLMVMIHAMARPFSSGETMTII